MMQRQGIRINLTLRTTVARTKSARGKAIISIPSSDELTPLVMSRAKTRKPVTRHEQPAGQWRAAVSSAQSKNASSMPFFASLAESAGLETALGLSETVPSSLRMATKVARPPGETKWSAIAPTPGRL